MEGVIKKARYHDYEGKMVLRLECLEDVAQN